MVSNAQRTKKKKSFSVLLLLLARGMLVPAYAERENSEEP